MAADLRGKIEETSQLDGLATSRETLPYDQAFRGVARAIDVERGNSPVSPETDVIPDLDPALVRYASERGWHLEYHVATTSARFGPPVFTLSATNLDGVAVAQSWGSFRSQDRAVRALFEEIRTIDAARDPQA